MNATELEKAQNEITDAIYARAIELGFDEKTMQPITDGVCDFEGYLNSKPKVNRSGNRILFDAYHPARKGQEYVDTLIEALKKYFQKNK